MIVLGHLTDASLAWDQRIAITQLIDRLPSDRFTQRVATIGETTRPPLSSFGIETTALPRLGPWAAINGSFVDRFSGVHHIDLWHTWSVSAAACAVATGKPVVLDVTNPLLDSRRIRKIRTLAERPHFRVACGSQIVRRRLVEGGVPPTATVVVRPGIDFAVINQFRRSHLRKELGIARDDFVIVCPERLWRSDGHFDTCLASSMLNRIHGHVKMILPGQSIEQRRIARLASGLPVPQTLFCPEYRYPTEQLIAMADALVIVPRGDIATTAIAWAMASETVVIGTATYAVAELISNNVNGALFKQTPGRRMVSDIARLLQSRRSFGKLKDTARGQAYEVFSLRRFAEQTMQLYENARADRAADSDITDPAMVG